LVACKYQLAVISLKEQGLSDASASCTIAPNGHTTGRRRGADGRRPAGARAVAAAFLL